LHFLLLIEDVIINEGLFIFLIKNFIGFAFGERTIDFFDGFEPDGFGVAAHVEEEFLGFRVHGLD
jgi:hypothetical protein